MFEFSGVANPSLKLAEPEVDGKNPWGDDLLIRASLAEKLTGVVDKQELPVVVSVDGGWGTGKTFFLKRWSHDLRVCTSVERKKAAPRSPSKRTHGVQRRCVAQRLHAGQSVSGVGGQQPGQVARFGDRRPLGQGAPGTWPALGRRRWRRRGGVGHQNETETLPVVADLVAVSG